jgi:hypothetical protein
VGDQIVSRLAGALANARLPCVLALALRLPLVGRLDER